MSFWSFIGLPGKKEFEELQINISSLIEENRLLREDNKRLFQLIKDENGKCIEEMKQQFQDEQKVISDSITKLDKDVNDICDEMQKQSGSDAKEIIENIHNTQELLATNINSLLEEMKNYDTSVLTNLGEVKGQNEKTVQHILMNKEILNDNASKLLNIVDKFEDIDKQVDSVEEIHSKIVTLAESVQNLWTITKLIWVDSLISDIDTLA